MFEVLLQPESWVAIATLTLLEIVLGIDNVVFIAIVSSRVSEEKQSQVRKIGLSVALLLRIFLLLALSWIIRLEKPLFSLVNIDFSGKALIMLGGGLFLITKATIEIYRKTELLEVEKTPKIRPTAFWSIIFQIAFIDLIFSLESIITAVGMVKEIVLMVIAVSLAMMVMVAFADLVSKLINQHASLKILALSFLLLIGVLLLAEGTGYHLPRGYVYFAMFFSLFVQLLTIRYETRARNLKVRV